MPAVEVDGGKSMLDYWRKRLAAHEARMEGKIMCGPDWHERRLCEAEIAKREKEQ